MVKLHPEQSRPILIHVFEKALRVMHPFMPFLTEELWQRIPHDGESIVVAPYPKLRPDFLDEAVERNVGLIHEIIVKVRNIRAEVNIEAKQFVALRVGTEDPDVQAVLMRHAAYMKRLARVKSLEVVPTLTGERAAAQAVAGGVALEVPLAGVIDLEAEQARLSREMEKIRREISALEGKLSNKKFIERAPREVVEENHQRLADYQGKAVRLAEGIDRLR